MYTPKLISPAVYIFGFLGITMLPSSLRGLFAIDSRIDLASLFIISAPLIWSVAILGFCWKYFSKGLENQKILDTLIQEKCYTNSIIVDIISIAKNKRSKRWYKYICRDIKTEKNYESDLQSEVKFKTWSNVKILKDEIRYPGLYWVDLNTVTYDENNNFKEYAITYKQNKIRKEFKDESKDMSENTSYLFPLIFLLVSIIFPFIWIFTTQVSNQSGPILVWYCFIWFGILFFIVWVAATISIFRNRKLRNIKSKNIETIGIIETVERVWSFKNVPFGFCASEIKTIDNKTIDDEDLDPELYGYPYRFRVNIVWVTHLTEVFDSPFPKKYSSNARIRLYFSDLTYSWEFMTDLDSIDELN